MQLYIGNKNYSSWSMRPWVLMKQAGIAFDEVPVRFDAFTADSQFKATMRAVSPSAKVPVLIDDGFAVWDTLAIAEYLAEKFPERHLWPVESRSRARARSLCAEMHAGFSALRNLCPMNIEAQLPEVGVRLLQQQPALRDDLAQVQQIWSDALAQHRGPMLFDAFSIADAYFAPVVMRLQTYALPVSEDIAAYMRRVQALPGVAAWIADAQEERDFLDFEEPYRRTRD